MSLISSFFETGCKAGDSRGGAKWSHLVWFPLKLSFWSSFSLLQPTWLTHHSGLLPLPLLPDHSGGVGAHAGHGLRRRRRRQRRHQCRASLPGEMTLLHNAHICKYGGAAELLQLSAGSPAGTRTTGSPDMGVYRQLYFPQRLSNEFVLSTHPAWSQMCCSLLRLALEKLAGSLKKTCRQMFLGSDCEFQQNSVASEPLRASLPPQWTKASV